VVTGIGVFDAVDRICRAKAPADRHLVDLPYTVKIDRGAPVLGLRSILDSRHRDRALPRLVAALHTREVAVDRDRGVDNRKKKA
jgi:hypothetical protein